MKGKKLHSVLAEPHTYKIDEFRYRVERSDRRKSFIDMSLSKGAETVVLRFWQPTNLQIEKGFPEPTHGLVFYDVSSDGLEDIGVEVDDFEASLGAVSFSARKVEKLTGPI